jgi:hypothetical protein
MIKRLILRGASIAPLLSALPLLPVHAQSQNLITLSCNGTAKYMASSNDMKPDPIAGLGVIVNLSERTVSFQGFTVPIVKADNTTVNFSGEQTLNYRGEKLPPISIHGTIDRVTGAVSIMFLQEHPQDNTTWDVQCRTTTRLF